MLYKTQRKNLENTAINLRQLTCGDVYLMTGSQFKEQKHVNAQFLS